MTELGELLKAACSHQGQGKGCLLAMPSGMVVSIGVGIVLYTLGRALKYVGKLKKDWERSKVAADLVIRSMQAIEGRRAEERVKLVEKFADGSSTELLIEPVVLPSPAQGAGGQGETGTGPRARSQSRPQRAARSQQPRRLLGEIPGEALLPGVLPDSSVGRGTECGGKPKQGERTADGECGG